MLKGRLNEIRERLEELYRKSNALPFHGWHHVQFVRDKALQFAQSINADLLIVELAALTHDLNYIVEINSEPDAGANLRKALLEDAGFGESEICIIERVILEAHTKNRVKQEAAQMLDESKALSDADTLFKALPITPVFFACRYLTENGISLSDLAYKITTEQNPLMDKSEYFYTPLAREYYGKWAQTNLDLWNNVTDALKDRDVQLLLSEYFKLHRQANSI
jgi:uncharacterized protein